MVISVVRLFRAAAPETPEPAAAGNATAGSGGAVAAQNKSKVVETVTVHVESGLQGVEEKVKVVIPTVALTNLTPSAEEGDEPTLVVSPINLSSLIFATFGGGAFGGGLGSGGASNGGADGSGSTAGSGGTDGGGGASLPPRPLPKRTAPGEVPVPGDIGTPESNIPLAATQLDLRYLISGEKIEVKDLETPVYFTMPSVKYAAGMTCMWYDEELNVWSSEGTGASPENVPGESMTCWTRHFSLFGAFIQGFTDVFLCAQFHLFTPTAISRITQGNWYKKLGGIVLWVTESIIVTSFFVSAILDYRRNRALTWMNEYFLIPRYASENDVPEIRTSLLSAGSVGSLQSYREEQELRCWYGALSGPLIRLCSSSFNYVREKLAFLQGGSAMWDAIDDVAESWFESFGDVRSFCEGLVQGLEMSVGRQQGGRVFHAFHGLMCNMTLLTSRRLAGANMGLSDEVVTFVLEDKDLRECLTNHHITSDLVGALGPGWQRLQTREEVWLSLHDEVCTHLQQAISKHDSWFHFPMSITRLFFAHTPFGAMWTHNIFMSCKMRALFFAIEVMGAFLLCAFFFQASGAVEGVENEDDEECGSQESDDIAYKMGRLIAVGLGSVFISGLPVNLLNSLHTRHFKKFTYPGCPAWKRQLRAWEIQDQVIWVLGSSYLAFGTFFVMLFLANISEDDHLDFSQSGVVAVLQNCAVLPAALAVSVPLLTGLLISLISRCAQIDRNQLLVDVRHRLNRNTNAMLPVMQV